MLEKKLFWTRVRGDHEKWGNNNYVQGVIVGIQDVVCNEEVHGALWCNSETGDCFIPVKCRPTQYQRFVGHVEKRYPGLCEFNVKRTREEA